MSEVRASELSARPELADWRVLVRRLEATFRLPSFPAAAALIASIADAADAADHHPDVDLRYPGVVHVVLTTHASGGLTTLDAELAETISRLARDAGATSEPQRASVREIGIDALDIAAVRPFWQAVLGYREVDGALVDPLRIGPDVWFQQMDEPRPQRNRIHIDVIVAHDVAEQRVADAIAAGGRLVSDRRAKAFWVLADVEGNEACVCTWQDRGN